MIERRVVRRYAAALYSAASRADAADRVESDLGLVSHTAESAPVLMEAVGSPLIPADRKRAILRDLFAERVHPITLNYLYLLVEKRREEALVRTEREFVRMANEARGVAEAQVTTAVPATEDEQARLRASLSALTGRSVRLEQSVVPEILGGVVVRIGDTVMDGSLRGQLDALRRKMSR